MQVVGQPSETFLNRITSANVSCITKNQMIPSNWITRLCAMINIMLSQLFQKSQRHFIIKIYCLRVPCFLSFSFQFIFYFIKILLWLTFFFRHVTTYFQCQHFGNKALIIFSQMLPILVWANLFVIRHIKLEVVF